MRPENISPNTSSPPRSKRRAGAPLPRSQVEPALGEFVERGTGAGGDDRETAAAGR